MKNVKEKGKFCHKREKSVSLRLLLFLTLYCVTRKNKQQSFHGKRNILRKPARKTSTAGSSSAKTVLSTLLCFRRCSNTKGNKFVRLNLGSDNAQQKHGTNNTAAQQVSRSDGMGSFEEISLIKDLGGW